MGLNTWLIAIAVLLNFFPYGGLLFAYFHIRSKNKSLKETKSLETLTRGMLRFLRKHNYSREIIVERLKSRERKLLKMKKLIKLGFILLAFYLVSRTSQFLILHYYLRRDFDFLNIKDIIMLLGLNFVVFTILWRKIALSSLRIQIDELSRLLSKCDMTQL